MMPTPLLITMPMEPRFGSGVTPSARVPMRLPLITAVVVVTTIASSPLLPEITLPALTPPMVEVPANTPPPPTRMPPPLATEVVPVASVPM